MRSIRIPQDRVGALIGPKGETKRMIQRIAGIKIDIDAEEGEVLIHDERDGTDPLMALKMKDSLRIACINRGGKIIFPRGQDTIEPEDTVIVVTTHAGLRDISDILR